MKTYKEEVIERLEAFTKDFIFENFEMNLSTYGIKIFQKAKPNKVEIPVGTDHIATTKELLERELNSQSNYKLNSDVQVFLKGEKDEIIHRAVMIGWNGLAEKSKT